MTAVTRQADPFCTGNEQRSFRLLGFSLRRYGKNDYVPFRSRTDRHAMISISLMREDKRCHGRQQKDEGWLNIMVARHDDGDDSIGDRRSSSLASTWSDENRLDMERWTVAGVERCQGIED